MAYVIEEIKENIKLHLIKTDKFKTNLLSVFLTVPLDRKTVTGNAIIPAVLRRGTAGLKAQEEISKELENMYGAAFDCGVEKTGDNQILKFYIEMVNDEFLLGEEKNIAKGIELLTDIVFNPLIENNKFKEEYVNQEKENIKRIIEAKIDNKDRYAFERCIEEMYKNTTYGLYKYGYVEDLEKIDSKSLYEDYKKLIETAKIDIFISGDIEEKEIIEIIRNNKNINKINDRKDLYIITEQKAVEENVEPKEIEEKLDVTQGKLVIGTNVQYNKENYKYKVSVYNVILGEGATSKLFQNVREKAGLAYTASSRYIRQKNNIYIRCGIEIDNYEKAVKIIKEQLEEMKNGKITDEEIENAKKYILASIRTTKEEQDAELSYYFGQELSGEHTTFDKYEEEIKKVSKKDVEEVAKTISIDTIYFLRN